jgi:hypothetical protein
MKKWSALQWFAHLAMLGVGLWFVAALHRYYEMPIEFALILVGLGMGVIAVIAPAVLRFVARRIRSDRTK